MAPETGSGSEQAHGQQAVADACTGTDGEADADMPPPPMAAAAARAACVRIAVERVGLTPDQATELEAGVYNWALAFSEQRRIARVWRNPRFTAVYASKARSVLANLAPDAYVGNARLLARMREQEFRPRDVAAMRPENVFPQRWQRVMDLRQQRDEYLSTARPAAVTDQFRCSRCKKRECEYQEAQLRSCDEPATLFITCLNCGHRWRLG